MALDVQHLNDLTNAENDGAWRAVIDRALEICRASLSVENAPADVMNRDRSIGELDHFLSSVAWDLWEAFGDVVPRNAAQVREWWDKSYGAKAVLVLDGLSLREMPWFIDGAKEHNFTLHTCNAYGAEIPSETNTFAKALGFNSRSQLQNNGGSKQHRLTPARTECTDLPWKDCGDLLDTSANWIFWHEWPDVKLHTTAGAGKGLKDLTEEIAAQLTSEDFWAFLERLATGRRLLITSDHGYAATGEFFDAPDEQATFLKGSLRSGRFVQGEHDPGPFVPPVALQAASPHGAHLLALGRWKWKSQGGYPTLAHGGLSLLEMLCPFIELTK